MYNNIKLETSISLNPKTVEKLNKTKKGKNWKLCNRLTKSKIKYASLKLSL